MYTRIGPRWNAECGAILTSDGSQLLWVDKLRCLGVFIVSGKSFRCCSENAKKSCYQAFNALFGKIGRAASEEVIISLIKSKCVPCLLFCLEVCPLNKTDLRSLNFSVTRVLMKIFRTFSVLIINECQIYFSLPSIDTLVGKRKLNFSRNYCAVNNVLCNVFAGDVLR